MFPALFSHSIPKCLSVQTLLDPRYFLMYLPTLQSLIEPLFFCTSLLLLFLDPPSVVNAGNSTKWTADQGRTLLLFFLPGAFGSLAQREQFSLRRRHRPLSFLLRRSFVSLPQNKARTIRDHYIKDACITVGTHPSPLST